MNRLIVQEPSGDLTCRSSNFDKVFPTLYAYEETGMTPEEVHRMAEYWNMVPANIKSQIIRICAVDGLFPVED